MTSQNASADLDMKGGSTLVGRLGTALLDRSPGKGKDGSRSCLSPVNGTPEKRQPQGPAASPTTSTDEVLVAFAI